MKNQNSAGNQPARPSKRRPSRRERSRRVRLPKAAAISKIGICQQIDGNEAVFATTDKKAREPYFCLYDDAIPKGIKENDAVAVVHVGPAVKLPDASDAGIALARQGIRQGFGPGAAEEAVNLDAGMAWDTGKRTDLTHIPFVTIDPASARDHDDAIYVERRAPENIGVKSYGWTAYVAIADVAAYVRPDTKLDAAARLKGNSTYFPDRVEPMLPERISNDLCSLVAGADRPALVAVMQFDNAGICTKHEFVRARIRVAHAWSYDEAYGLMTAKDNNSHDDAGALARLLHAFWLKLNGARERRAPLDLDMPERRFEFDASGRPRVVYEARHAAHMLVEELMIQANVAAAKTLLARGYPGLFRVHAVPPADKVASLREFLRSFGLSVGIKEQESLATRHFNKLLGATKISDGLLRDVVLRSQSTAEYSTVNSGHYGLGLTAYAHFTSPIRRYADLIVHRSLISCLELGKGGHLSRASAVSSDLAAKLSAAERGSMAAEREVGDKLAVRAAITDAGSGNSVRGRISGVAGSGLFVAVEGTGADAFVPVRSLSRSWVEFDERRRSLVSEAGDEWRMGDEVTARIKEANWTAGGLTLQLA